MHQPGEAPTVAPSAPLRRAHGSQAPHGSANIQLVDIHLQLRSRSGTGIDERPLARDDAHLDRYSASREGASGDPVDPNVDKGLTSLRRPSECSGLGWGPGRPLEAPPATIT